jgi:hypothetical protein
VSHLLFLFALAGLGLLFYVIQLLVQWRDVIDITWKFEWAINYACWDAAMLVIVLVLMWLWLPSPEVKALAYQDRAPLEWRPRPNNNNNNNAANDN